MPAGSWDHRSVARLGEYRKKRDPKQTPEPFGGGATPDGRSFVIQRHDARRLHYDLRLERDGALASWAVPKGLPLKAGERHLAVHVEDHPLEYASFEGTIPAGEYGAGTVEIWDRGTYELLEEKSNGGLTVRLQGERLDGVWTLVPASLDGNPKNWLLMRKDDHGGAGATASYSPMLATAAESLPIGDGVPKEGRGARDEAPPAEPRERDPIQRACIGQSEPSLGRHTGTAGKELLEQRERQLLQRRGRRSQVVLADVEYAVDHGSTRRARIAAR